MRLDVSEACHPTSAFGDNKVTSSAVAAESKSSKATGINDNASGGYGGVGVISGKDPIKGESLSQMACFYCLEYDK